MNTYMVHMLERAREVHKINEGDTHRDSMFKCPFCVADEDEQWFKYKNFGFHKPQEKLVRPERMPAPHCTYCPLQSLFNQTGLQELMDDCVEKGFYALRNWEDTDEEDGNYTG